ncbi:MAG TPA: hypothetical protein VHM88_09825 [Candidatus Acidoferrales bacterium]|jgi:hypothetical protein|nr:hypothetical protein [Candidatus Acidoferrales bacterium]
MIAVKETPSVTQDSTWKGAYKAGGIALIIGSVLSFAAVPVGLSIGRTYSTGEGLIKWAAASKPLFLLFHILIISGALAFVPAGLVLFLALKDVTRAGMLIAVSLWELEFLDIVREAVRYSVTSLSDGYFAASSDAQRAAYVAVADLVNGVSSGLILIFLDAIFFASTLIIGVVMLRKPRIFNKAIAYWGIVGSIFGLAGSPYSPLVFPIGALGISLAIGLLLVYAWGVPVGYKLYKLGSVST